MGANLSNFAFGGKAAEGVSSRKSGHTYTSIVTRDNARAHYGDSFTVRNYHTSISLWPQSLPANDGRSLPSDLSNPKRKRIEETDIQGPRRDGQNPVDMAINHLGELYHNVRYLEKDEDAQRLIRWLRVLVDSFADEYANSQLEHTLDGLERLQHGLLQANRVKVNSASVSRRTVPTHLFEVERKSSVVNFGMWKLQLDTTVCDSVDTAGRDISESFSSLRLTPTGRPSVGGSSVAAFFGERTDYLQRSVIHPTIIAYRNLDGSSKVFELVRRDDVDGLIRLIALQEASTRDCDADGRSLLNLSCAYRSVRCCKFLIDCGADVDRPGADTAYGLITPLHMALVGKRERTVRLTSYAIKKNSTELVQLLSKAGADPTTFTEFGTPLTWALNSLDGRMNNESAEYQKRTLLMLDGVFTDLKTADPSTGLSAWLRACKIALPDLLRKMLAAGCDVAETYIQPHHLINEQDYRSGWSCLFFLVLNASNPRSSEEFEALQLVLRAGADPFLRDTDGYTIFDILEDETSYNYTDYRRGLWYTALQRADIDFDHVKPDQSRQTMVYGRGYTPVHSRALRYLDSWEQDNIESQVNETLVKFPWSEEESRALLAIEMRRRSYDANK